MELFNLIGLDIGYVVIGMAAVIILLFILLIVSMVKSHNVRVRYNQFMNGEDGKNLEKAILDKFSAIDTLQAEVSDINSKINAINTQLATTYQKVALVKYDAFQEIGGKLSFVLVLLTAENNGFILNSMHSSVVVVKTAEAADTEKQAAVAETFQKQTGCGCEFG